MTMASALNQPNDVTLVTWRGISGATYTFQLDLIGARYLVRPGVYIFCKRAQNGNWNAVYIGETASFYDRLTANLQSHHKLVAAMRAGATHICTLHVPGELALREAIETDLRRQIPTPCNDQ